MREVVVDTETTGLNPWNDEMPDRIVEVACIELLDGYRQGERFHRHVNPEREVPAEASKVHGLTLDDLRDKPVFAEIAEELRAFIGEDRLVIHNAEFDLGFLNMEFERAGMSKLPLERTVDTLQIARKKYPGARNNLDKLAERLNISTEARKDYHGALTDARILLEVYLDLTGNRQQDLGLNVAIVGEGEWGSKPARQRETPLGPLSSREERRRHAAFVRQAVGGQALWLQSGLIAADG